MPDTWKHRGGPRPGSPQSAWVGEATEKDWPKRPSDCQLPEARKRTLKGPELLWQRRFVPLHTWRCHGLHKPSSCATFTLNSHWGRAATGKQKCLTSLHTGSLQPCPTRCNPRDCGLPGFSVRGVLQEEYWSILANTGCHTLPEHHISCLPSRQHP